MRLTFSSPTRVGLIQSVEGLNRTKTEREDVLSLPVGLELGRQSPPALRPGLGRTPSALLPIRPSH